MATARHAVRFKGVTLGSFTAGEIAERLRAGELSLTHAVEHRGQWMTVRQFLREGQPSAAGSSALPSLLGRLTGKPGQGGDQPPPPPGAEPPAAPIESRVRLGYLWCGLTFVMPILLGLPTWGLVRLFTERTAALKSSLAIAVIAGAGHAAWRAHRGATELMEEGLEDVGRSMRQLAIGLAAASAVFWITIALFFWS